MALVVRPGLRFDRQAIPVGEIATESMSPGPCHGSECRSRQPSACSGASARCTSSSERAPTRLRPAIAKASGERRGRGRTRRRAAVRRTRPLPRPRQRARAAPRRRFPAPPCRRDKPAILLAARVVGHSITKAWRHATMFPPEGDNPAEQPVPALLHKPDPWSQMLAQGGPAGALLVRPPGLDGAALGIVNRSLNAAPSRG